MRPAGRISLPCPDFPKSDHAPSRILRLTKYEKIAPQPPHRLPCRGLHPRRGLGAGGCRSRGVAPATIAHQRVGSGGGGGGGNGGRGGGDGASVRRASARRRAGGPGCARALARGHRSLVGVGRWGVGRRDGVAAARQLPALRRTPLRRAPRGVAVRLHAFARGTNLMRMHAEDLEL